MVRAGWGNRSGAAEREALERARCASRCGFAGREGPAGGGRVALRRNGVNDSEKKNESAHSNSPGGWRIHPTHTHTMRLFATLLACLAVGAPAQLLKCVRCARDASKPPAAPPAPTRTGSSQRSADAVCALTRERAPVGLSRATTHPRPPSPPPLHSPATPVATPRSLPPRHTRTGTLSTLHSTPLPPAAG